MGTGSRKVGQAAGPGVLLRHGALKAKAKNTQEANRFKWVVKDQKYFRRRATPGGGPPFVIEPGERWLDIGANVGFFALCALSHGARSVTCIEAEKENVARLKTNLRLNGYRGRRAHIVRAVVRGKRGSSSALLLSRKTTRHSILSVPEANHDGRTQKVPTVTTLRRLLSQWPCDAVKLNIEGAEREVLLSMHSTSWGPSIKKMVFEYSFDVFPRRQEYDDLLEHLRATDWQVFPEGVPSWFAGRRATWDRRRTLGNDARQIWAFRLSRKP
uniref:Methyltransferase FkbM domain-containing protein n=1 Tax=Pyrodinium bahamense TaxID=73915 RepID=A0A7S0AEY7_9DINO